MEETNLGPHSLRNYSVMNQRFNRIDHFFKNDFTIEKDEVIWRIEMPDVANPEVYTEFVGDKYNLVVDPKNKYGPLRYQLTYEEEVADASLALGVLTITIDRNINRVPISVKGANVQQAVG